MLAIHACLANKMSVCLTKSIAHTFYFSIFMNPLQSDVWRTTHLGCLLGNALRRFDARVLTLMSQSKDLPLKLSNYAARGLVTAAQIHLTRHLSLQGSRLVDMAHSAGMSKQAMSSLVQQCEAMGLVTLTADTKDARAKRIAYTDTGLLWYAAFCVAVQQATTEFSAEIGNDVSTVVSLGLEAYGNISAQFAPVNPHHLFHSVL
jgi:DNA-binding MarR family transcriptional regulator